MTPLDDGGPAIGDARSSGHAVPRRGRPAAAAAPSSLAQEVRRRREALRLTLRGAAEVTGISASGLWTLERGRGTPSRHTLERLRVGLGIDPGTFARADGDVSVPPPGDARPAGRPSAGDAPPQPAATLHSPLLVEREADLAAFGKAIGAAPAVVVVEGEAGVGKSRLVEEALASFAVAGRARVLAQCDRLREALPFGPVVDALRDGGHLDEAALGAILATWDAMAARGGRQSAPYHDVAEAEAIMEAILDVIRRLGPAVCVVENIEAADAGTIQLLRRLVWRMPRQLVLVLTARREGGSPAPRLDAVRQSIARRIPVVTLRPGPLTVHGVRTMVAAIAGLEDVSEPFASHVHHLTAGIPFAVEETVRLVDDLPRVARGEGRWLRRTVAGLPVPDAVRDLVLERVALLPPPARAVVEAAAVLETPSDTAVLQGVAGLDEAPFQLAVAGARAAGILVAVPGGRLGLRHALAVSSVYAGTTPPRRRRLHARAAAALAHLHPEPVAQLAHHHAEAGQIDAFVVVAEAAADRAAASLDDAGAVRLLRRAVLVEDLDPVVRGRLAVKLGWSSLWGQAAADACGVLRVVVADGRVPVEMRGEVEWTLGLMMGMAGDAAAGYEHLRSAAANLRSRPGLAARVMSYLAMPWVVGPRLEEHAAWLEAALGAARQADEPEIVLDVLCARALFLLYTGSADGWDAAAAIPRTGSSLHERRHLVWASMWLAGASLLLGHGARARAYFDDARHRAAEVGYSSVGAELDTIDIVMRWNEGRWEGLDGRARHHAEMTADLPQQAIPAQIVAASLRAAGADDAGAEELLTSALEGASRAGFIVGVASATAGLARLRMRRGDAAGALEEARHGLDAVRGKGVWVWGSEVVPAAVEAMLATGARTDACDLVGTFARALRGRDAPLAAAALTTCRGMVADATGRAARAARLHARAERALAGLSRPYDAARSAVRRGAAQLAAGEAVGADTLVGALAAFRSLGAPADENGVRRILRSHDVALPYPWRGGRPGYGLRMSPRESEVARLAAGGNTNAQIAAALGIAPKTVARHLTAVLRKLGVTSRHDIDERLSAPGSQTA